MNNNLIKRRKKLIEVSIPLKEISKASSREKSIRHGHPSTLHLWWARRPLASARAVIFCQIIDDPSDVPEEFPTIEDQDKERMRLFSLLEEIIKWENTSNNEVFKLAKKEFERSWIRFCDDNEQHPEAKKLFRKDIFPSFHDPFAGGGALPIEAQRFGLTSYASDLNPIAVSLNKAMIEIPPLFADMPPVHQKSLHNQTLSTNKWIGSKGLASDVVFYANLIRNEAEEKIGDNYPKLYISEDLVNKRPDLAPLKGQKLNVTAWIFARTVESSNPAFSNIKVPLASSFLLSTKKGQEHYIEPIINGEKYKFEVKFGKPEDLEQVKKGTKLSRGANFKCLLSGTAINGAHIKKEGKKNNLGCCLMAIVAEGPKGRIYAAPDEIHNAAFKVNEPKWKPDISISGTGRYLVGKPYGIDRFEQLFSNRQLNALNTFSDLIETFEERIFNDALRSGMNNDDVSLRDNGRGAKAYSEAIKFYLSLILDKCADYWSNCCTWSNTRHTLRGTFGRQAIPLAWDYAEANPFSSSSGNWNSMTMWTSKALALAPSNIRGYAIQSDASVQTTSLLKIISTDPPYYDNVPYADISDFFYVWLRKSIRNLYPKLFATITVPKKEELVAADHRQGGKEAAKNFFIDGMTNALSRLAIQAHPAFPITIFYAFKQSETKDSETSSTGWETFLSSLIRAGLKISGTWPMRTELATRLRGTTSNALSSSMVLVCQKRNEDEEIITRKEFRRKLKETLPLAIRNLSSTNIAPVDVGQAAIGPGMSIFSQAKKVVKSDDSIMSVKEALIEINSCLYEYLTDDENQFDLDTLFAITLFETFGYSEIPYGEAEVCAVARNISVDGVCKAGIIKAYAGKVKVLTRDELLENWDPFLDNRICIWEATQYLIKSLEKEGEVEASQLLMKINNLMGQNDIAQKCRALAYRLFNHCEKTKQADEALSYNGLIIAWPDLERMAAEKQNISTIQEKLF